MKRFDEWFKDWGRGSAPLRVLLAEGVRASAAPLQSMSDLLAPPQVMPSAPPLGLVVAEPGRAVKKDVSFIASVFSQAFAATDALSLCAHFEVLHEPAFLMLVKRLLHAISERAIKIDLKRRQENIDAPLFYTPQDPSWQQAPMKPKGGDFASQDPFGQPAHVKPSLIAGLRYYAILTMSIEASAGAFVEMHATALALYRAFVDRSACELPGFEVMMATVESGACESLLGLFEALGQMQLPKTLQLQPMSGAADFSANLFVNILLVEIGSSKHSDGFNATMQLVIDILSQWRTVHCCVLDNLKLIMGFYFFVATFNPDYYARFQPTSSAAARVASLRTEVKELSGKHGVCFERRPTVTVEELRASFAEFLMALSGTSNAVFPRDFEPVVSDYKPSKGTYTPLPELLRRAPYVFSNFEGPQANGNEGVALVSSL